MPAQYKSVLDSGENTVIIQKSKFICYYKHVESEEQAKDFISSKIKENPFATHNCFAYQLKSGISKFSDDGEPQGTAGLPIFNSIKNNALFDVCIVVTRYFGGIKLGAGGLTRAYGNIANQTVLLAKQVEYSYSKTYSFVLDYEEYPKIRNYKKDFYKAESVDYGDKVLFVFSVKDGCFDQVLSDLSNILSKKIDLTFIKEGYSIYEND